MHFDDLPKSISSYLIANYLTSTMDLDMTDPEIADEIVEMDRPQNVLRFIEDAERELEERPALLRDFLRERIGRFGHDDDAGLVWLRSFVDMLRERVNARNTAVAAFVDQQCPHFGGEELGAIQQIIAYLEMQQEGALERFNAKMAEADGKDDESTP